MCKRIAASALAQRGMLERSRRDRLPRSAQVSSDESERLIKMEETLHQRVIGQEEAVVAISRAIRRARVGLKNPNRPIASFIFSGAALHLCSASSCGGALAGQARLWKILALCSQSALRTTCMPSLLQQAQLAF